MTQVKEMTNPELNRVLAELMGYTVKPSIQSGVYRLMKDGKIQATSSVPEELMWSYAPEYCTDPAASLEVQTAAIAKDEIGFIKSLEIIRWGTYHTISNHGEIADLFAATLRERSEAAYMVLSQVRE